MEYLNVLFGSFAGAVAGSAATALRDRYDTLFPTWIRSASGPISPGVGSDSPGVHRATNQRSMGSFWTGRSACRSCGHTLQWFELIPIASWLLQRGRCRSCGAPIGATVIVLELTTAGLGAWAATQLPPLELVVSFALAVGLGAIVLVDLEEQLIPDRLVLVALPLALALGWLRFDHASPLAGLAGLLAGLLMLGLWRLTRGRGIGLGDVKLASALGLGLGWLSLFMLQVAFVTGGIVAVGLLASGRARWRQRVAFGPFLVAAFWLTILVGPAVLAWYS